MYAYTHTNTHTYIYTYEAGARDEASSLLTSALEKPYPVFEKYKVLLRVLALLAQKYTY